MNRINCVTALAALFLATLVGCSGEQQAAVAMRRACLSNIGLSYHMFLDANKRSPRGVDEFAEYIKSNVDDEKVAAEVVRRLEEKEIIVFWNAELSGDGDENDKYVLAFEADCAGSGGYLVMGGGAVEHTSGKKFVTLKEIPQAEAVVTETLSPENSTPAAQ